MNMKIQLMNQYQYIGLAEVCGLLPAASCKLFTVQCSFHKSNKMIVLS